MSSISEITKRISKPLCVFDLETTGLDVKTCEIIQFAAFKIEPNGKTSSIDILIKPTNPIPKEVEELTGISNAKVAKAGPFSFYVNKIVNFISGTTLAGYNISGFDLQILNRQLQSNGIHGLFDNTIVYDALEVFKKQCPKTLASAHKYYTNRDMENAHNALADVLATVDVIAVQVEREDHPVEQVGTETFPAPDKRVGLTSHILIDDDGNRILNFGAHKGKSLASIPSDYLAWIYKSDFPNEVKAAIKPLLK